MPIYFASNIHYLRRQNNLSQEEMQARTGILRSTWSNYENGHTEPSFETLKTIADFFQVGIDDLLMKELDREKTIKQDVQHSDFEKSKNKKRNYPIQDEAKSYVNEKDETEFWVLARELKRINEKLDDLSRQLNNNQARQTD